MTRLTSGLQDEDLGEESSRRSDQRMPQRATRDTRRGSLDARRIDRFQPRHRRRKAGPKDESICRRRPPGAVGNALMRTIASRGHGAAEGSGRRDLSEPGKRLVEIDSCFLIVIAACGRRLGYGRR